jgi:DNA-binding NtrC family response regulator
MNSNLVLRDNPVTTSERVDVALSEPSTAEKLASGPKPTLRSMRAAAEIIAIRQALQETGWNRKRAAQLLSISYRGLLYKLRQHRIVPQAEDSKVTLFARKG